MNYSPCPPTIAPTIDLSFTNEFLVLTIMSQTHATAASSSSASSSSSSSNFQLIVNNALDTYKKRTKKDLCTHPLSVQLQSCDSPSAILALLQQQVQSLDQSRSTDEQWTKWLGPTVNVLFAFSNILGAGVSLVCPTLCTCPRSVLSYLCGSYSPLRASSLPESASSFQCVSLLTSRVLP